MSEISTLRIIWSQLRIGMTYEEFLAIFQSAGIPIEYHEENPSEEYKEYQKNSCMQFKFSAGKGSIPVVKEYLATADFPRCACSTQMKCHKHKGSDD